MTEPTSSGFVYIVGAGPGPRDLMTLRALDRLHRADVVVHDRLISSDVLDEIPANAERVYVGKALGAMSAEDRGRFTRDLTQGLKDVEAAGADTVVRLQHLPGVGRNVVVLAQQQAQHARRQYLRLASARRSGQPHVVLRVDRRQLVVLERVDPPGPAAAAHSSRPSHSSSRISWS